MLLLLLLVAAKAMGNGRARSVVGGTIPMPSEQQTALSVPSMLCELCRLAQVDGTEVFDGPVRA